MIYSNQWSEVGVGREACGETAVKMALSDSGITPTLLEMVNLADAPRDGTTAADLLGLFTHYGVKAQVHSGVFPTVYPAILLFNYSALARSEVQDTNFLGLHWFVLLGVDGTDAIVNDPDYAGDRAAEGDHKHYKLSEVKTGYAGQYLTWENKVSTLPTKGVVKSDASFLHVRDSAGGNVIASVPNGSTVMITGQGLDASGKNWYSVMFPLSSPILFSDELLTMPYTYNLVGWCAGWLIDTGTAIPPVHNPVFTAAPSTVVSGAATILSWKDTDGASGIFLDGVAQAGPTGSTPRYPTANTTFTLKVTYPGAADVILTQSVVVTQPVVPPVGKVMLGFHTLGNNSQPAIDAGARFGMVMDGKENNQKYANVGGRSMFRRYVTYPQSVEAMAQDCSSLPDGSIGTGVNECEQIDCGSAAGILAHAAYDVAVATRLKQLNPKVRYAGLTTSCGCPDITRQDICDALKQGYSAAYNSGLMDIDMHLYSPNMTWIYKGMTATVAVAKPLTRYVGEFGHGQVEVVYYSDEPINPKDKPALALMATEAATYNDNPTAQDWFETRWHFLFTRCGFDPKSTSRIYSGEASVDEGGIGSFTGHNATDQDVVKYAKRWLQIQSAPIIVNGVSYPSPFYGGCFFQLGDTSNAQGHWGSYSCDKYLPAMKAAGLWA